MKMSRLTALIRKEVLEALRAGWANIPLTAAVTVVLLVRIPYGGPAATALRARILMFMPLLAMPFYASTVLSRAIQTERLRGGLLPLLVYGGPPAEVWLAKLLGAFSLAYGVMLLSLGGYVGYGAWEGYNWMPPLAAVPYIMLTMPVIALSLIALEGILFWVMARSAMLSVAVPIVLMFGGAQLVITLGSRSISATTASLAMLASCAVVVALTMVVALYPRERAAGVVAR